MSHEITWPLLARYFAEECSPSEEQAVEAWIEADPTRRQLMVELESIWEASEGVSSSSTPAMDLEADWNQLSEAMDVADAHASSSSERELPSRERSARPPQPSHRTGTRVPSLQNVMYVLLAGLLLVGGVWFGLTLQERAPFSENPFREVVAGRGEQATVQLSDGSKVRLNVDSRLQIPSAFGDKRTVYLEGEAYFDVATDSTHPFIVHTQDAIIDVHGTAFNVRSYPEDQRVQVAVVEGSVSLRPQKANPSTPTEGIRLRPKQIARLDAKDRRIMTQTVDSVGPMLGWMDGRLIFENASLREVTTRLERWYNLQFDITDPALTSLRYTASLKSRSVENVLDVITASLNIQYRIEKNTVVLTKNASSARTQQR